MSLDLRLGGARGIAVRADAGWFALAALVTALLALRYFPMSLSGLRAGAYWALGATGALALFLSIVAHELAHVVVARRHGVASRSISLDVLGGRAEVSAGLPAPGPEMLMAIVGPAANLAIALLAALLMAGMDFPPTLAAIVRFTALINALLAAVNLLPVLPLDGGRILRAFLWSITGSTSRATRIASRIGTAFALALILLGAVAAVAGLGLAGLLAAATGLYLLRRGAPFLSVGDSPTRP